MCPAYITYLGDCAHIMKIYTAFIDNLSLVRPIPDIYFKNSGQVLNLLVLTSLSVSLRWSYP
jgi:hypothetical protein